MTEAYIKLGEIATYINGYAFKPKDRGREGLPIIRIQDLTGNSNDKGFYKGKYPSKIEINNGDILISWSASLGVYIWNSGRALLNQHIFKVVFDKKAIDRDYFVYAVQFSLNKMKQLTHGATMKHVVKKDFENVSIPYPSLTEQRKIACILDKLKKSMSKRLQELKKLDELIKARFVEMFGNPEQNEKSWKTCRLGDECRVINGRAYKAEELLDEGKYRVLRVGNFFTNDSWYYSDLELDEDKYCEDGDLLFAWSASFGPRIWRGEKVIYHYHIWKLIGYESCFNKDFLVELLNYNCDVMKRGTHGSTMLHFTKSQMEEQKLILPPMELQNQFTDFVHQVNKSKVVVQKALDEAHLLFDSLMQEYFE